MRLKHDCIFLRLLGMRFRHTVGCVLQAVALDLEETGILLQSRFNVEARALLAHKQRQLSRRAGGKRSGLKGLQPGTAGGHP